MPINVDTTWRDKLEAAVKAAMVAQREVSRILADRTGEDECSIGNQDDPYGERAGYHFDGDASCAGEALYRLQHKIEYSREWLASFTD